MVWEGHAKNLILLSCAVALVNRCTVLQDPGAAIAPPLQSRTLPLDQERALSHVAVTDSYCDGFAPPSRLRGVKADGRGAISKADRPPKSSGKVNQT